MSEHSTAQARASVMLYDNERKQWQPSGGSAGLSRVNIYHHPINNTFRIVGRKLNDHAVVINCALARGLKYNKATPTFHQWRDQRQVYGLNFQSKKDAEAFGEAVRDALETLKEASFAEDVNTSQSTLKESASQTLDKTCDLKPPQEPSVSQSTPEESAQQTMDKTCDLKPPQEPSVSVQSKLLEITKEISSLKTVMGSTSKRPPPVLPKPRQRQPKPQEIPAKIFIAGNTQLEHGADIATQKHMMVAYKRKNKRRPFNKARKDTFQSTPEEESASRTMYKMCDLKPPQEPFVFVQSKSLENTKDIYSKTVMESTSKRRPPVPKPRQRQPKQIPAKTVNTGDTQPEHGADCQSVSKQSVRDIITKMQTRIPTDIPLSTGASDLERVTCPTSYQEICANCEELPPDVLFEPCLHIIACQECAWKMRRCLKCKTKIERKVTHDGETLKEPPMVLAHAVSMDQLNELKKELDEVKRDVDCQICMEQRCNTLFNCGHKTCSECSKQMRECPYCKRNITERKIMY